MIRLSCATEPLALRTQITVGPWYEPVSLSMELFIVT